MTTSTITRRQAIQEARSLQVAGAKLNEISAALAAKGYHGPRSGKPLAISAVAALIKAPLRKKAAGKKAAGKKAAGKKAAPTVPRKTTNKLSAVLSILSLDLSADERLALIELVLT